MTNLVFCDIISDMFDKFIYTMLDKIIEWCERYKKYRIKRSLPKETWDLKTKKEGLKKWVNERENSYK